MLSNEQGKIWSHGWIEFDYKNNNYILDTSMVAIIKKEIYYSLFSPKVYVNLSKEDIMRNSDLLNIFNTMKNPNNELNLEELNLLLWPYEEKWLEDLVPKQNNKSKVKKI